MTFTFKIVISKRTLMIFSDSLNCSSFAYFFFWRIFYVVHRICLWFEFASWIMQQLNRSIQSSRHFFLSNEVKNFIRRLIKTSVKINIEKVLKIWKISKKRTNLFSDLTSRILWIETGDEFRGYEHVVQHKHEFESIGIKETELIEFIIAATTIKSFIDFQGSKNLRKRSTARRSVFVLIFKNIPLAVAMSIGENDYCVGMNRGDFENCLRKEPSFDKMRRYLSRDERIISNNVNFHGWIQCQILNVNDSNHSRMINEYRKNKEIAKISEVKPFDEWIYSEYFEKVGKNIKWYQKNLHKNSIDYL